MDANSTLTFSGVMQEFVSSILLPGILALGSYLMIMARSYIKRITVSIEAKNELEQLKQTNEIKSQLLKEIESMTKSAVASNMQRADAIKRCNPDHKLTDDEASILANDARDLVISSLPDSLTKEGSALLSIIGGADKLQTIINGFIEKHVYEYKANKK